MLFHPPLTLSLPLATRCANYMIFEKPGRNSEPVHLSSSDLDLEHTLTSSVSPFPPLSLGKANTRSAPNLFCLQKGTFLVQEPQFGGRAVTVCAFRVCNYFSF